MTTPNQRQDTHFRLMRAYGIIEQDEASDPANEQEPRQFYEVDYLFPSEPIAIPDNLHEPAYVRQLIDIARRSLLNHFMTHPGGIGPFYLLKRLLVVYYPIGNPVGSTAEICWHNIDR
jgi:hypothetical protein